MPTVSVILLVDNQATEPAVDQSLEVFNALKEIREMVIVCHEEWQEYCSQKVEHAKLSFAQLGERRQDSVYNGLKMVRTNPSLVCIHDAGETLITLDLTRRLCQAAEEHGASTVGLQIPQIIKECDENQLVTKTLNRSYIWETKTPQVIRRTLLEKGFDVVIRHNLTVVDDASLVELIGEPVQIVDGTQESQKVSTKGDLTLMKQMKAKFNIKS